MSTLTTERNALATKACETCQLSLAECAKWPARCCHACSHTLADAIALLTGGDAAAKPPERSENTGSPGPEGEAVERVRAWLAWTEGYVARIRPDLVDADGWAITPYGVNGSTPDFSVADLRSLLAAVDRLTEQANANVDLAFTAAFAPAATFDEVSPSQQLNAENDCAGLPSFDALVGWRPAATREDGSDGG